MDPVSYLFSAYLNTVQTNVQEYFNESMNLQVTPVEIVYEGVPVAFQHHTWKIRDRSVCSNVSDDLQAFSDCTVKAKELFGALCTELSKGPLKSPKHGRLKNMYCNASIAFKPTIARVGAAQEKTELELARQECNAATVAAMGSREPKVLRTKKKLCEAYQEMKAKAGLVGGGNL